MVQSISFPGNIVYFGRKTSRKHIEIPKNIVDLVKPGRYQIIINALGTIEPARS